MSKRKLKAYLSELPAAALQEQVLDLYTRFGVVKTYYDFVFNPREEKMIQEAKAKIGNEYFPIKRKRPRARRSVAQKLIKHFKTLGMDPVHLAEVMCYNIEIAQTFSMDRKVNDAFYKSIANGFKEFVTHVSHQGLRPEFKDRILKIAETTKEQQWPNIEVFERAMDILEEWQ